MNLKAFITLAMIATSLPLLGQIGTIPESKGALYQENAIYTILKVEPGPIIQIEKKYPEKQKGVTTYKRENYSIDFTEYTKKIDPDEAVKYVKSLLADNQYKVNDRIITLSNGKDLEQNFISWASKKAKEQAEMTLKEEISKAPIVSDKYKLNIDFAGLYLGCSQDEALRVMNNSNRVKFLGKYPNNQEKTIAYRYSGNIKLNATETCLTFWNNKLMKIKLTFPIETEMSILKSSIEEKYGKLIKNEEDIQKNLYYLSAGAKNLPIELIFYCPDSIPRDTQVSAIHKDLIAYKEKLEKAEKAAKIGSF